MNLYDIAGCTNIGLIRSNNEDNFFVNGIFMPLSSQDECLYLKVTTMDTHLFALWDGMGGEACGEIASYISAETFSRYYPQYNKNESLQEDMLLFQDYITEANELVCSETKKNGLTKMGTTFCCLAMKNNQAIALNLGDSRAYLFRDSLLKQLTTDHTEAERMVRLGIISREQSKDRTLGSKLNRHLGIPPDEGALEPSESEVLEIKENDIYLLCSDGLTDMLSNDMIEKIISSESDSENISKKLMAGALNNGGIDNITIVVVRITKKETVEAGIEEVEYVDYK